MDLANAEAWDLLDRDARWSIDVAVYDGVRGIDQSGRLEVSGNLHDLVVGPAEARSLIGGA
jgi:hypothetical protein